MKSLNRTSLFFAGFIIFLLGIFGGLLIHLLIPTASHDETPDIFQKQQEMNQVRESKQEENQITESELGGQQIIEPEQSDVNLVPTGTSTNRLCVDTDCTMIEYDCINETQTSVKWKLPDKYIGMNQEQFVEALNTYLRNPSLEDRAKGLQDITVLRFSREQVEIRKSFYNSNLREVSFYLGLYDNRVAVYSNDRTTLYQETEISLESLSEAMKSRLIDMIPIYDEKELYDYLENMSS